MLTVLYNYGLKYVSADCEELYCFDFNQLKRLIASQRKIGSKIESFGTFTLLVVKCCRCHLHKPKIKRLSFLKKSIFTQVSVQTSYLSVLYIISHFSQALKLLSFLID